MKLMIARAVLAALLLAASAATPPALAAESAPQDEPWLPPHVDRATFGSHPSTGNPALDCGIWADPDYPYQLSDQAQAAIELCLDLHGWTYDTPEDLAP